MIGVTRIDNAKKAALYVLILGIMAVVCLAVGGNIVVDSTNSVNCYAGSGCTQSYRWEPSSATASSWVTSWHDWGTVRGNVNPANSNAYTSYWSGGWAAPTLHQTTANNPLIDTYLHWDAYRGRYMLVALDTGNVLEHSVWVQSGDSSGANWNTIVSVGPMAGAYPYWWDFPSVAVNSTSGQIVVGAARYDVNTTPSNSGYWSAWSSDGGNTWNGPYLVTYDSLNGSGNPTGGGFSRIVWSASGFHVFWPDCTNAPNPCVLKHYQSSDGQNWTRQSPDIGTYDVPLLSSSSPIVCSGGTCGELSYAANMDAVASSGLGWVVAFPVNISGMNAVAVATELGSAGATVTYSADLFSADVATSSAGDWYLSYQTYQNGVERTLPIEQGVNYRSPSGQYAYGIINSSIDPSQWMYLNNTTNRCTDSSSVCFAAGDWFRPAMNQYTGASIPMVLPSANLNDTEQSFIQDPQTGNAKPIALKIQPYVTGTNLAPLGVITPAHLAHVDAGQYRFVVSTPVYLGLVRAGVVSR